MQKNSLREVGCFTKNVNIILIGLKACLFICSAVFLQFSTAPPIFTSQEDFPDLGSAAFNSLHNCKIEGLIISKIFLCIKLPLYIIENPSYCIVTYTWWNYTLYFFLNFFHFQRGSLLYGINFYKCYQFWWKFALVLHCLKE